MVKRELLIVVGFGLVGVVAYQLTAVPRPDDAPRFSLTSLLSSWRDRATRSAVRATVETIGTLAVSRQLSEIRISAAARLTVVGEDRDDIAWRLTVEATGRTEESARAEASQTALNADDLGDVLSIRVRPGSDARPVSDLTLRVPARLQIRAEQSRQARFERVAGVRLENLVGDVNVDRAAGEVTGSHRNGTLRVRESGAVRLTLVGSTATFERTAGETILVSRNGQTRVDGPAGPVSLDTTNDTVVVTAPAWTVRANSTGGDLTIEHPREAVHLDTRRTAVTLVLDRAVPITAISADGPVALRLIGNVPIALDAAAIEGLISAEAFGLTPERTRDESRLQHQFGDTARVSIRNTRGPIVIASGK